MTAWLAKNNAQRILLTDYGGHAFTAELARTLRQSRGIDVTYSYCTTNTSPKGRVDHGDHVVGVSSGGTFEKYNLRRRLVSELRYGWNLARHVRKRRPDLHIVCNMPLVALLVTWLVGAVTRRHPRLVVWFQDAQSGLASGVLGRGPVPRLLDLLEGFLLRRASHVIAISEELAVEAERHRVRGERLTVLENWAPIDELPVRPRLNSWSTDHGLDHSFVFMYSGTLARKHRADMLVDLARAVRPTGARVLVVSEGSGADWLREQQESASDLQNLDIFPYQPFGRLPDVLATADVLLVLLEPTAGRFSVPSKTLSYICAARPVLASMPGGNTAARILTERARAGLVVEPGDSQAFCARALDLVGNGELRTALGAAGRAYAEKHFDTNAVADRFLAALGLR